MKSTTQKKKTAATRPKKRATQSVKKSKKSIKSRFGKLHYVLFAAIGIIALILGTAIFNHFKQADVYAQTPLPIQTFTTTYKGYNPGNNWMSWLTDAQRCTKSQTIYGAKPSVSGNYPTLIYMHGSTADLNKNNEGQRFIEKAASQGFHALAVTYTSSGSMNEKGVKRHANCIFNQSLPSNALTAVCATSGANCAQGVLLSGFSQGGSIAVIAKNYNSNVKAVWGIGVSAYIYPSYTIPSDTYPAPYGTRSLPNDKLVLNMGESSNTSKRAPIAEDLPSLKKMTGVDCGANYNCLQSNGAGYYVVSNTEIKDKVADHCYWMMVNKFTTGLSCTTSPKEFDPGFQPPATTQWSMIRNLEWLRSQL